VVLAEWSIKLGSAALIENIATETSGWVSADYAAFAIKPSPQGLCSVYLKNWSSRMFSLIWIKRRFLQKSKILVSNGSLPAVNSFLKPIRPV
jgi:hypothetical protein